ncbi:aminotransferase class V-fold PLP-dependent enzyme [Synechococcales cyanobacterium C]|uniref:Aminotransferase class V-fold PLP-dependent enzyme n=1 Tax=Petrachloros mirabilis ULC683 TaxID=2781853 RepID=A0A8K1ZZJ0_9CYAN|nr:aminotransferase class V-fold PLP-dependent enzyme [Petrachloros mirabilis]NCJ06707.1 aminotransferase class V-fold PLP-dependent enzyme [Petrachloros mirabilis ULC683]
MTELAAIRAQFPALAHKRYFNYGGQGPLPEPALEAIQTTYRHLQVTGPFSGQALDWVSQMVAQTRAAIAQELGAPPATFTLTDSVTSGCNIALWGLDWHPGDHLLLSDCEHPGVIATAQQLHRRLGVELSTCPILATLNQGDPIATVIEALQPRTRLVVLSHILWNTGQVLPLGELMVACRQHHPNILFLIDAAQSVGVLPLNLAQLGADFYAFTGHKWWCGPDGVGGLYVNPAILDQVQPTYIGWRGIETNASGQPTGWKPDSRRFEIATTAYPLYTGLKAALDLHPQGGTAAERYQRILQLSQQLWTGLATISGVTCLRTTPPESGLISFQIAGWDCRQAVQHLEKRSFHLRVIAHPYCIRACTHYLTQPDEIMALIAAIQALVSKR